MKRTRYLGPTLLAALLAAWWALPTFSKDNKPSPTRGKNSAAHKSTDPARQADEQAVRKASAAYVEAMNKNDAKAIIDFWAPDADYIDQSGNVTHGRAAISTMLTQAMPQLKGCKYTDKVRSIRFLRPEIALEDGTLECCDGDGCKEGNRYAILWSKTSDGRWLIENVRDLPGEVSSVPSFAYPQLRSLEWLVGDWHDATPGIDVKLQCHWAPNKSFLLMDYTVKRPGEEPMQVTQRIGWDPGDSRVRSWVFDSNGGFGEALWEKDGNRWTTSSTGILPDGGSGSSTNVMEYVDNNTFVWRSKDREVDGQPVADVEVKFVRQTKK